MGFGMWLFWLAVLGLIFLVIKAIMGPGSSQSSGESPLDILKKRYANGEIDEEEYRRRKTELEK